MVEILYGKHIVLIIAVSYTHLKVAVESYKKLFGKEPIVKGIHAGLECGLFSERYPNLDMVSFGPTPVSYTHLGLNKAYKPAATTEKAKDAKKK